MRMIIHTHIVRGPSSEPIGAKKFTGYIYTCKYVYDSYIYKYVYDHPHAYNLCAVFRALLMAPVESQNI